jgi:hypothetical protein
VNVHRDRLQVSRSSRCFEAPDHSLIARFGAQKCNIFCDEVASLDMSAALHPGSAQVNVPILSRSVGGTSSADAAIVFRIPGISNAYTAHASEDGTIFVQSREVPYTT